MRGEEVNEAPTRMVQKEMQRLVDPRPTGYELAEDPARKPALERLEREMKACYIHLKA